MNPRIVYMWFVILMGVVNFRSTSALKARPTKFPWLVRIFYDDKYVCGGTIVDKRTILTSNICVYHDVKQKNAPFTVRAGDYNTEVREEFEQTIAVQFIKMKQANDIAVLKLEDELKLYSIAVYPIKMADRKIERNLLSDQRKCFYAGIGSNIDGKRKTSKKSKKYRVIIKSTKFCQTRFLYNEKDSLCSKDKRERDDNVIHFGEPLACYNKKGKPFLVGFVSLGRIQKKGLIRHTRIAVFKNWVQKYM